MQQNARHRLAVQPQVTKTGAGAMRAVICPKQVAVDHEKGTRNRARTYTKLGLRLGRGSGGMVERAN